MIEILVELLIVCVVAAVIVLVINQLGLPAPWGRVVQLVVAALVLIWLLQLLVPLLVRGSSRGPRLVLDTLALLA